jgi:hypothetical protein
MVDSTVDSVVDSMVYMKVQCIVWFIVQLIGIYVQLVWVHLTPKEVKCCLKKFNLFAKVFYNLFGCSVF